MFVLAGYDDHNRKCRSFVTMRCSETQGSTFKDQVRNFQWTRNMKYVFIIFFFLFSFFFILFNAISLYTHTNPLSSVICPKCNKSEICTLCTVFIIQSAFQTWQLNISHQKNKILWFKHLIALLWWEGGVSSAGVFLWGL